MDANINILDGKMQSANYQDLLIKNFRESNNLKIKGTLTQDEKSRLNELQIAADQLAKKIAQADNANADAAKQLSSGRCIIE